MAPPVPTLLWMDTRKAFHGSDVPRNEIVVFGSLREFARRDVMDQRVQPTVPYARRRHVHLTFVVLLPDKSHWEVIVVNPTRARVESLRVTLARRLREGR